MLYELALNHEAAFCLKGAALHYKNHVVMQYNAI